MTCVNEEGANKIARDNKIDLENSRFTESNSGIEYNVVNVNYGADKSPKGKILSYTVWVWLSNDEDRKQVQLEDFRKQYRVI